jgi:hypothetical protein
MDPLDGNLPTDMEPAHEANEKISRKKISYAVSRSFRDYLLKYGRELRLPLSYATLRDFSGSMPLYDKQGRDTLWETVFYNPTMTDEIHMALKRMYSQLKASGDTRAEEHLHIERIDYCVFGNSKPFRIKIVNNYNEVHDYFYIKIADASRIWGLELEHLLSAYRINYLIDDATLVEEHIPGIPGDVFSQQYLNRPEFNPRRIAKEFVKFNERCFMRLLGDMRSYNFVFDITQDFDEIQFRMRSIDFDQQAYEGRKTIYLPQFFKENTPFIELVRRHLHPEVIKQYQVEERALVTRRMAGEWQRIQDLEQSVREDDFSTPAKIAQLCEDLSRHHDDEGFLRCRTMGALVERQLHKFVQADRPQP